MEENSHFPIDNKDFSCDHGGLHPMIARKNKYIQGNAHNQMKEIFIKLER